MPATRRGGEMVKRRRKGTEEGGIPSYGITTSYRLEHPREIDNSNWRAADWSIVQKEGSQRKGGRKLDLPH